MAGRIWLGAITLFWAVMSVLLWRAELGGGRETVASIPFETVFDRVLSAADQSTLLLTHHGDKIGQIRWMPSVIEATPPVVPSPEADLPEGMIKTASGYRLDVEANLYSQEPEGRWRITSHIDFSTNRLWTSFSIRLNQRPTSWEISAKAGDEAVHLRTEDGRAVSEQTFTAKDLTSFGPMLTPVFALLPKGILPKGSPLDPKSVQLGLKWTASNDWLKLGGSRIRVYKVRAKMLDRYEVAAYFGRSGELLKITLPDTLQLVNEAVPMLNKD